MTIKLEALLNPLLPNIIQTSISFGIVAICTLTIYMFFFKKVDTAKHQNIRRKRLIYVMLVIDVLILTKIWVDGFSHIITVLSLMAAGLVVANKESMMNLIGGLIISWRDLFSEGDFIQVQNFSGYVASLGIIYFKLYETTSIDQKKATGRTIKIPNHIVITSAVVNFSPDSNLCLHKIYLDYIDDQSLKNQLEKPYKVIKDVIEEVYKNNICYQHSYVKSHNRELSRLINLQPTVSLEQFVEKELHLRILVQLYCFSKDYSEILEQFWLRMN